VKERRQPKEKKFERKGKRRESLRNIPLKVGGTPERKLGLILACNETF
jgi:hypothetical protein